MTVKEISEYITFPRTFDKYRWYKPILVLIIGVFTGFIDKSELYSFLNLEEKTMGQFLINNKIKLREIKNKKQKIAKRMEIKSFFMLILLRKISEILLNFQMLFHLYLNSGLKVVMDLLIY